MALTAAELFGAGGSSASGTNSGGSTFVVIPPAAVATAGPLAITQWLLNQLVAAQAANVGTNPQVISRQSTEIGAQLKTVYTVTMYTPLADVADDIAANVVDNFA